jgi:glucosamine--fructose-6-phosphate aminotransferase (isomerizing)
MHQQIDTLPELVRAVVRPFDESARGTFDFELCTSLRAIALVGCGDSYHASYGAELAFNQLAGLPTQAYSALTFSRYTAAYLPAHKPHTHMTIAVSVSGVVSRTIEALRLAQQAGSVGVALTGRPGSLLGESVERARVFQTTVPPLPDELNSVVPGVRSYLASQVALYLAAVRIGEVRGHLTTAAADGLRAELSALADVMERTIAACEPLVSAWGERWSDSGDYCFVGGGPLLGASMFSAAKVLEASGDPAVAQETEEWTHIQYFSARQATATFFMAADGFSADRTAEAVRAAYAIGQRTAVIATAAQADALGEWAAWVLPIAGEVRECFAPLVYSIPGELIAADRAERIGAAYFRAFGGGRTVDWADGASRIRDSHMLTRLPESQPDEPGR